jgi:hypothetical protein
LDNLLLSDGRGLAIIGQSDEVERNIVSTEPRNSLLKPLKRTSRSNSNGVATGGEEAQDGDDSVVRREATSGVEESISSQSSVIEPIRFTGKGVIDIEEVYNTVLRRTGHL